MRWNQICKDGSIIHTEVVTTLLPDSSGKVIEILGVSRDITERKLAQKEIARLNEELENVLPNEPSVGNH